MPPPQHQVHTGAVKLGPNPQPTPGMPGSTSPGPTSGNVAQPGPPPPTGTNGNGTHTPAAPSADAVLDAIGARVAEQLARQVPSLSSPPRQIDWLGYLQGVGTISTAAPRGDWVSVAAGVEQLVTATGAQLDSAAQSDLVSALAARFATQPLAEPTPPAGAPAPAPKK
jgi:hypothetical protein